jgi:hypothetical protein
MAEKIDKEFHESFDAPEGTVLRLDHGDGNVEILPWEKATIDVVVIYRGEVKNIGIGGSQEFSVEFRESGKTVSVVGKEKSGSFFGGVRYKKLDEYTYTVQAPSYVLLDLDGEDGDVSIADWTGEIDCRLDDGDIHLAGITAQQTILELEDGDVDIAGLTGNLFLTCDDGNVVAVDCETKKGRFRLEDGDLTLKQCSGNFDIKIDDGDIRFSRVRIGNSLIRGEDGDLDLELLEGGDIDLDIETDDGSVRVDLEEGISVEFSIRTDDGRLEVDLAEATGLRREEDSISGELSGGKGQIRIRTTDGNVTLREIGSASR